MSQLGKSANSGIWITVLSAVSFGLYPPLAQLTYQEGASSGFVILACTLLRTLPILFVCFFTKQRLFRTEKRLSFSKKITLAALLQTLTVFGIFESLQYLPGPITVIILFSYTFFLLLFSILRGEEKFSVRTISTTLIAFFGLSLALGVWQQSATLPLFGILLAGMAAVCSVFRIYIFGKEVETKKPAVTGAEIFLLTSLFIAIITPFLGLEAPNSSTGYFWLALAGIAYGIGTLTMFYGIEKLGAFEYSLLAKTEPIFTSIFSILLLGKLLSLQQYLGIAVVVTALIYFQKSKKKTAGC